MTLVGVLVKVTDLVLTRESTESSKNLDKQPKQTKKLSFH